MRRLWRNLLCIACLAAGGCDSRDASTSTKAIRPDDLVGKWRLVRAGGEGPGALNIKTQQIELSRDGTWSSHIEMQGQFAGMSMKGSGTWSIADDVVTYTAGANSGKS